MNLFSSDSGTLLTDNDFKSALGDVGVQRGDTLFVHSDVGVWGKLCAPRTSVLEALCDTFTSAVGPEGTIVMPAFTYSFCKGEVFDPAQSRSSMGALAEFFRTRANVVRTHHPLFSVTVWGARAQSFMDVGNDSFNERSIFGHLHRASARIIFFGIPFMTTFIHHIEQLHGVPYRTMQQFSGTIITDAGPQESTATYFVRPLDNSVILDLSRLEERLRHQQLLKRTVVGESAIQSVTTTDLYSEGMRMLDENVYSFLKPSPAHA